MAASFAALDRSEKIMGFGALALIAPEAGEIEGRTQFPEFGALPACYCERLAIARFRGATLIGGQ